MKTQLLLLFSVWVLSACSYKAQLLGLSTHPSLDLSTKPTNAKITVFSTKPLYQDEAPSLTLFGPFEAQKISLYKTADCSGTVLTEKNLSSAVSKFIDVKVPTLTPGTYRFSARLLFSEKEQSECIVLTEAYVYNPPEGATSIRKGDGEILSLKSDGSVALWGDLTEAEDVLAKMPELASHVTKLVDNFPGALKSDGSLVYWGRMPPEDPEVDLSKDIIDFAGYEDDHSIIKANGDVWTWGWSYYPETKIATNGKSLYFNGDAFAVLKNDGAVVAWGDSSYGGDITSVAAELASNVVSVVPKKSAFAAIKSDGSIVAWGDPTAGGDASTVDSTINTGVVTLVGNEYAYAALKNDGSVFAWGDSSYGGDTALAAADLASGVSQIIPVPWMGFAALKTNGTVVTWGDSALDIPAGMAAQLSSGVVKVVAHRSAIAVLKSDGSVLSWGDPSELNDWDLAQPKLTANVKDLFATERMFFALKNDGSAIGWGVMDETYARPEFGPLLGSGITNIITDHQNYYTAFKADGTHFTWREDYRPVTELPAVERLASKPVSAAVSTHAAAFVLEDGSVVFKGYGSILNTTGVENKLTSGVQSVYANETAAVAVKNNGSAVVWGAGLSADISSVAAELTSGVDKVYHTQRAFAVVKTNGSVVVWGDPSYGGDASSVAVKLTSGVVKLAATSRAFAALKSDGSVILWGNSGYGADASDLAPEISSGVHDIASTTRDFAAIKNDGTVVTWGIGDSGDSSSVAANLVNVVSIVGNTSDFPAFAALRGDGTVVAWGDPFSGGDVSKISDKLVGVTGLTPFSNGFAAIKDDHSVVIWQFPSPFPLEVSEVETVSNGGDVIVVKKKDGSIISSNGLAGGEPYAEFLGAGGFEALTVNGGVFFVREDGALIGQVPQYRLEL
jgi:alpha-tubulin suppressor-like RCC1 family protein